MSTYAETVDSLVAQVDDSGNLPDTVEADEGLRYAVQAEVRRRHTQSTYTKTQQELKAEKAKNAALAEHWQKDAVANLSATDKADLEELKTQDPEAWRQKIGELEEAQRTKFSAKVEEINKDASELTELEQRQLELDDFNKANPDHQITDDVIENDVPPRITNQLRDGKLTWTEYLEKVKKYVTTPKTVQKTKVPNEPNLGNMPGGAEPTSEAQNKQSSSDYKAEIF